MPKISTYNTPSNILQFFGLIYQLLLKVLKLQTTFILLPVRMECDMLVFFDDLLTKQMIAGHEF